MAAKMIDEVAIVVDESDVAEDFKLNETVVEAPAAPLLFGAAVVATATATTAFGSSLNGDLTGNLSADQVTSHCLT